jgi:hypothetical protein
MKHSDTVVERLPLIDFKMAITPSKLSPGFRERSRNSRARNVCRCSSNAAASALQRSISDIFSVETFELDNPAPMI